MVRAFASKHLAQTRAGDRHTQLAALSQTSHSPAGFADRPADLAVGLAPRERRRAFRRWRGRDGLISDGAGFLVACTIVDISDIGARVSIDESVLLPARFYLVDIRDRVAFEATLVRSAAPEYGLALSGRVELRSIARPSSSDERASAGGSAGSSGDR
jgi:hypothetical protein